MCLVIDMNTFAHVFNVESASHANFKPVRDWIIDGKGKLVCGGSKYWQELNQITKFLRFFNQLKNAGKVIKIPDEEVDSKMRELMQLCDDPDFDDPHITALFIVSGCKIFCSEDARSYPYIKRKEWYPKGNKPPKIYKSTSREKSHEILKDENIADVCKPCVKLKKGDADSLRRWQ